MRSWGHPKSIWTYVNGADWQRTEVSTSEDGRATVRAEWVNRRQEQRTFAPGDRLLYLSRRCLSQIEIQRHLWEMHSEKSLRLDVEVHQLDAVRPDEEED